MNIIRLGSVTAIFVVAALTLGAAGSDENETDGTYTIRVQTIWGADAPHEVAFRELLREFDDQRDNVVIVDESVGDETAYNDKLQTAIATGNVPDLVTTWGGASFRQYVEGGVYADLEPALNTNPEWRDFFLPLFENWILDGLDGVYGVPYEVFGVGLFYNKAIFDRLGLEPPRTIAEFEAVADRLLENDLVPMVIGNKSPWRGGHLLTNLMYKRFGFAKARALADRTAQWTDPDVSAVLALIERWHERGYFGDNVVNGSYNEEQARFHNGDTAMHMDGSWYLSSAAESVLGDEIGFVPFPYFAEYPEHRDVWMGGAAGGLSVSGTITAAKRELMVELLQHLTSAEAYAHVQQRVGGGIYPVRMKPDPAVVDALTVEYAAALETAEVMKTDIGSYDALPQMLDRTRSSVQGLFAGSSAQEAAEEIQAEIQRGSR